MKVVFTSVYPVKKSNMILPNNNNLNFLIGTHLSIGEDMTGGNIVLHKLAFELASRNQNVFIFSNPAYPHENIRQIKSQYSYKEGQTRFSWEQFNYPINKTIAIYPQTTVGNPFNCKHVVRWILYHTQENIEKTYDENDHYFNFGEFSTFRKHYTQNKLTVFDYQFDKLFNRNDNNRQGFCHILHKQTPENTENVFKLFNSKNLEEFKTTKRFDFNFLNEQLNKYEYFLTYDKKSFYTVAAVLCGCKAIILEPENKTEFYENAFTKSKKNNYIMTPTEFRLENPIQMFGVAFGLEDIAWADKTINLAREHLKNLEIIDFRTVDKFNNFWIDKLLK